MKKFGKKLAMLGLMATMSIVGAISSFAVSIEYSDASAVKETGITIPVKYGDITISKVPVRIVSNENLQFRYSRDTASEYINFGYIENGQFISTFFEEDQPALMSEEMYRYQQLIDKEQLKKDKASGVWQDRTYGIMMFAYDVNDMEDEHTGFYMWAFKIDTSAENNTNKTASVTTSDNDGDTQGWKQDSVGWWYQYSDGSNAKNGWMQDVDGKWYYFNNDGYMVTGWIQCGDKWYYCYLNGSLAIDCWIDDKYYVGSDGAMYVNTTTLDGIMVDEKGAKINQIYEHNQHNDYVGEYFWEENGGYNFINFKISKIDNGKIYGEYRQDAGLYSGFWVDFSQGVPIVNGNFSINACYQDVHAGYDPVTGRHIELVDYYTIDCSLDTIDRKPIIRADHPYWDNTIYIKY